MTTTDPGRHHLTADAPQCGRLIGRLALTVLLVVLVIGYALLAPRTAAHDDKDFTHLWLGGRMVVAGQTHQLYDPAVQVDVYRAADPDRAPPPVWEERNEMFGCFNYPPPAALAYAALAWLPLGKAAVLHAYLSIAAALATAWLLAIAVRRRDLAVPFAIILFVFPAFFINLSLNQNAVFTTLVIAAAWCLFDRKRDLAAGLVLSLLICKPNWLIAVGWIPLVHRRWRALAGIALGSLAITAISALALGTKSFADYYEVFRQVARLQNVPGYFLDVKYSGVALFRKWWGSTSTADLAGWLTSVMLIAATWAITRRAWRPGTPNMRTTLAAAFAAALWINPHLNYYDLFPLALCVGVMLVDWTTSVPRMKITAAAGVLLALLAIPWDLMWNWNRVAPVPTIAILVVWVWFAYVSAKTGEAEAPTSAGLPISRSAPSIAGTTS